MVLLSELSSRGEALHKALRSVCAVRWIARKSEFRADPVRLPLLLFREFLHLLGACRSAPRDRRPIIIVHSVGLDSIPAFALRRVARCRVVLYAVGTDVLKGKGVAHRYLFRWAVRKADVVLCENGRIEKEVRSLGGLTRILPVPFVPSEEYVEGKKEFDVVTVGNLTDAAKQDLLVEASAYLDPSVRIAIVGEGPERQYLTTLSRRHGQSQVQFLGDLPPGRIQSTLRKSSLYVQCSSEGPPSSVLEAACCGLPIIALDGDRDPELMELYGLRPIIPKDRRATSLATAIEGAIQNYANLLTDVSKNREALESYSRSWPSMAATAIFS